MCHTVPAASRGHSPRARSSGNGFHTISLGLRAVACDMGSGVAGLEPASSSRTQVPGQAARAVARLNAPCAQNVPGMCPVGLSAWELACHISGTGMLPGQPPSSIVRECLSRAGSDALTGRSGHGSRRPECDGLSPRRQRGFGWFSTRRRWGWKRNPGSRARRRNSYGLPTGRRCPSRP